MIPLIDLELDGLAAINKARINLYYYLTENQMQKNVSGSQQISKAIWRAQ